VRPWRLLDNRAMKRRAREAIADIGVEIPSIDSPVARLSGGQRQAIAIARSIHSDARILLLDEPLAAMGVREGAMVLDLISRLRESGEVSIIMILHNYVHVFQACDRVNLISDGEIVLDKPTEESSIEELTELVVKELRNGRRHVSG
jgi:ABC-type sugar transport system ATPase subunit